MNVLITSASRKVSLVRAFQSALARYKGGNVIAVDITPYAPALYFADKHFLVSRSDEPDFVEELLHLCQRERVGLLVPTRDEELPVFASARRRFEATGTRVLIATEETVQTCQDKKAFTEFCKTRGFGIPRTYQRDQWLEAEFPAFIKPRFGKGARGARLVIDKAEIQSILDSPDEWIVQEYVRWPEYTIDLLSDFGGRPISTVPRLRQLVVAGEAYISRTSNEPELIEEAGRLAKDLRLVGHNTIQCFWDGKQVKFIEVNPRFGGAAALGIAAGADSPMMLVELVHGEELPPRIGEFEPDLVMLRFTEDLFFKASALESLPNDAGAIAQKSSRRSVNAKIQAVLFDLDNTLYPEEEFVVSGFRAAAKCLAACKGLDADELVDQMRSILRREGRAKLFNTLLQEIQLESSVWIEILLCAYRSHQPSIKLFPEAISVLETLRGCGIAVGLITDGMASVQRQKIAALGLKHYMDIIVCTDELGDGCGKPSTVPFEVALTLLGIVPSGAAYVADDVSKDFAGPNQMGMTSIQIGSGELVGLPAKPVVDPAFLPQIVATSLGDILGILKRL